MLPDPPAGEDAFMDDLLKRGIPPGNYGFPDFNQHDHLPRKERMEKLKALYDRRPYGTLRVWGEMNMGVNMLLTFFFYLFTSAVIGYLGWATLPHGADTTAVLEIGGHKISADVVEKLSAWITRQVSRARRGTA